MPFVENNVIKIHYQVVGDGMPLILQHGNTSSLEAWKYAGYIERLAEHFKVIAVDARGHGKSSKPYEPEDYTLEKRASDIISVLDQEKIDFSHYWGYSMGGWIGYGIMKYHSKRFNRFIIGGAQPYESSGLVNSFNAWLEKGMPFFVEKIEAMFGRLTTVVKESMLKNDPKALIANSTLPRTDISADIYKLDLPCLLYAGNKDPIFSQIKTCAENMLQCEFVTLNNVDHNQAFLRSDLILNKAIDFLRFTKVEN